jgi:hypothetical protein
MRILVRSVSALAVLLSLSSEPLISLAQAQQQSPASPHGASGARPIPDKPNCTNNGTYVNSQGQTVQRPENCSEPPAGATAQCRDGSYSFSKSRRGTCSRHGGVAKWL